MSSNLQAFVLVVFSLLLLTSNVISLNVSQFGGGLLSIFGGSKRLQQKPLKSLKAEILALSKSVNRGLTESPEERKRILEIFEEMEKMNPTRSPLVNPNVNAIWNLEYTTSIIAVVSDSKFSSKAI
jgi:hypothetical protein